MHLLFRTASSVAQGELGGQFVLSFRADAKNVLVTEAEELVNMVSYPDVLTDMTVSLNRACPAGHGMAFNSRHLCPVVASTKRLCAGNDFIL